MQRAGRVIVASLVVAAAALALAACGDDDDAGQSTDAAPPAESSATGAADAIAAVDALLREGAPDDDRVWQRALTPRLPRSWPPRADTEWVVYAYATVFDPQLADGVHVSDPFARIVEAPDGSARVEPLGEIGPTTIQGVAPLTGAELAALQGLDAAVDATRSLTAEPAAGDPAATTIREGYGAWLAANGAIAARLPDEHAAFLAWAAAG